MKLNRHNYLSRHRNHPVLGILIVLGFSAFGGFVSLSNDHLEWQHMVEEAQPASPDTVDPQLDGQIVHIVGQPHPDSTLKDDVFPFKKRALAIERDVQRYLWVPSQDTPWAQGLSHFLGQDDGALQWSRKTYLLTPDETGDPDPTLISPDIQGSSATMGPYRIDASIFASAIGLPERFDEYDEAFIDEIDAETRELLKRIEGDAIIVGLNPAVDRQVGDEKVLLRYLPSQKVSMIALQSEGELITPTDHPRYDHADALVGVGEKSPDQLLESTLNALDKRGSNDSDIFFTGYLAFFALFAILVGVSLSRDYRWTQNLPRVLQIPLLSHLLLGALMGLAVLIFGFHLGRLVFHGPMATEFWLLIASAALIIGLLYFGLIFSPSTEEDRYEQPSVDQPSRAAQPHGRESADDKTSAAGDEPRPFDDVDVPEPPTNDGHW